MNVCCISRTNYWQGLKGGMDLHGRMVGEGLYRLGHRVSMISTSAEDIPEKMNRNGVDYYHLADTRFGSRRHGWPEKSIRRYLDLHRTDNFDLLWSQSFDAYGAVALAPKGAFPPVMLTLHGSVAQEFQSFKSKFTPNIQRPEFLLRSTMGLLFSYFKCQRPLLHYAGGVIAVSDRVVEDICRLFGRSLGEKCRVVPNGIDTEKFRPDPVLRGQMRKLLGLSKKDLMVLTLGRIDYAKGHHLGLESVIRLNRRGIDTRLVVAGDGPDLPELKSRARAAGLEDKIRFEGHVEHDRTPQYYNAADIFIMPTMTLEGLPFVLLEAMACGTPVVASNMGGNCELVRDHVNGLLVKAGDAGGLADKTALLAGDPGLAARLSRAARETVVKEYGIERMISHYEQIMETIVSRRKGVAH